MISDIVGLYRATAPRLERIVARHVHAPATVIEDACQTAWCQLVCHADRIDETTALSWLATTAVREAVKRSRRDRRESSLEAQLDRDGELNIASEEPTPEELVLAHERIGSLRQLTLRQQRSIWLHAAGLSYDEIAETDAGLTTRTVERQIYHGRRRLRTAA